MKVGNTTGFLRGFRSCGPAPAANAAKQASLAGRGFVRRGYHPRGVFSHPTVSPLRWRCILELARGSGRAVVTNAEDQATLAPHLAPPPALIISGTVKRMHMYDDVRQELMV